MAGAAQVRGGRTAARGGAADGVLGPAWSMLRQVWDLQGAVRLRGLICALSGGGLLVSLATRHPDDASWNAATGDAPRRGALREGRDGPRQSEFIEGVRNGAAIEPRQALNEGVTHVAVSSL